MTEKLEFKVNKRIDEEAVDECLKGFIEEMIKLGYSEWYIGRALAHILKALEANK